MPSDVDHVDGHFHLFTIRLAGLLAARLAISRCAEGKAEGLMNRSVIQVNKQVCVACQPEEISQRWPEMRNVSADKCAQKPLLLQMARGRVGSKQQDGLHLSAVGNVPSPSSEQKKRNQWTQGQEWNNCFLSRNILSGSGTKRRIQPLPYKSVCCFRKVRSNCSSSSRSQLLVSGPFCWTTVGGVGQ